MTDFASNGARTSPLWSLFDPTAISGATWKVTDSAPEGILTIQGIKCNTSGGGVLKFRTASAWKVAPPGSNQTDGWHTRTFVEGEAVTGFQITEIDKAGSSGADWEVLA